MLVINNIPEARNATEKFAESGKSIGLVPTMGALHNGHLSLLAASKKENDITIASLFVNPLQFNNPDDLKNYPTSLESDLVQFKASGCDVVFVPTREEMYPHPPAISFGFGYLEEIMEGLYRPGHFKGVALVVNKLFNILNPTRAYFGQKDLQQFKIIETMVSDLSMRISLRMMPIIREKNGLALSSRNSRLTRDQYLIAAEINRTLIIGQEAIAAGNSKENALAKARQHLSAYPAIKEEYLTLVKFNDLREADDLQDDNLVLCFAGYLGAVRLIDNLRVKTRKG